MSRLSKPTLLLFVAATLAGSCLHFLYTLFPSLLTSLIAPVNESLWEHLKLLYWPCLVSGLLLTRGKRERLGNYALVLLLDSAALLGIGWFYHVVLGGDALFFDVALYVLLMAAFFLVPPCLEDLPPRLRHLSMGLVAVLGVLLLLFTLLPPDHILFADLSAGPAWAPIPY